MKIMKKPFGLRNSFANMGSITSMSIGLVHHDLPVVVTGRTACGHHGRLQAGSETSSTSTGAQESRVSFNKYTGTYCETEAPILLSAVMGSLAKHAS